MLELKRGNVPDVVVFYDGYNETAAAYATGQPGVPENFAGIHNASPRQSFLNAVWQSETGQLLSPLRIRSTPNTDVQSLAQAVTESCLQVYRIAGMLSREYGFEIRFFWQPQLFTDRKPLTHEETALLNHPWLPRPVKELTTEIDSQVHLLAEQHQNLTDIGDVFNGVEERIYPDLCHVSGSGNRRIAQAMLKSGLLQVVRQRSRPDLADRREPVGVR